ncbi:DNA polymerase delta subunit 4, putative [Penicillium digitatum PHI26]|uniref:DNA polymerase delta subunit 4, putative n=2 Tax=Penicillium digitatum TaxID=36651 RepID=K9GY39_PEND2|nr:DNA polymerase delta subunit 4, putative [Penicillium digitatum Pd1]EKV15806.1 DNA polymerase delta subunit 4, putative [Penicillium digitatum Pd1]EKV17871.1 DNA polymerase delta subunit 4, putative [Penicillium digitatum PHI26]
MPRHVANKTGQSTLSFGGRVTKPVTTPSHKAKALDLTPVLPDKSVSVPPEPQQLSVTPNEPSKPHVAELAVRRQASIEHQAPRSEEDKRALKVNKQDIWRYWQVQEQIRKAPRAHQQGMDIEEKILRHFDLSSQYGLNPPIEVLAVLLKGQNTNERAHIDELLS